MSSENVTQWGCDGCGATTIDPEGWQLERDADLCPSCAGGELGTLLLRVAELDDEARKWKALWRSQRDDADRLRGELKRIRTRAREVAPEAEAA